MIDYEKTNRGDILKLVGQGAPGFGVLGDLVRVIERTKLGVLCENKHGSTVEFVYNCGAARLEPTEWRNDFPTGNYGCGPGVPLNEWLGRNGSRQ